MNKKTIIDSFIALGNHFSNLTEDEKLSLFGKMKYQNQWFSISDCRLAIDGLIFMLSQSQIDTLLNITSIAEIQHPKKVAIVMAGNIPGAGFHDLMAVLISGHIALIKTSSLDHVLIQYIVDQLIKVNPDLNKKILFVERLNDIDAVIATGSDNTAKHFEYYFAKYPHIIRKNRSSVAVLHGKESDDELLDLAHDILSYFGKGCRNVSKIFIPKGHSLIHTFDLWQSLNGINENSKYGNNYDYQRTIRLMNQQKFFDTGFLILEEKEELISPISVLYYQEYDSLDEVIDWTQKWKDKIQCISSNIKNENFDFIKLGQCQKPNIWDFADGFDTFEFLKTLHEN